MSRPSDAISTVLLRTFHNQQGRLFASLRGLKDKHQKEIEALPEYAALKNLERLLSKGTKEGIDSIRSRCQLVKPPSEGYKFQIGDVNDVRLVMDAAFATFHLHVVCFHFFFPTHCIISTPMHIH